MKNKYCISILESELSRRQEFNSSYSLRAYARDLALPPSRLSEILSGKSGISEARAKSIARQLDLSGVERDLFVQSALSDYSRGMAHRKKASALLQSLKKTAHRKILNLETFKLLSHWVHFAVLELIQIGHQKHNPSLWAKKLNLPEEKIEEAIDRLHKLNMIEHGDDGYKVNETHTLTPGDVPSKVIRDYHSHLIKQSLNALETQSIEERDYSSVVLSINKHKVPEAKELIKKFRQELSQLLDEDGDKDSIYCLGLQFFRLDQDLKGDNDV